MRFQKNVCRFCAEIIQEQFLIGLSSRFEQPAHKIILLPTVKLENLLPIDMDYQLCAVRGRIKPGSSVAVTSVSLLYN